MDWEDDWTEEEEAALRAGVRKHCAGKWRKILNDPDLAIHLVARNSSELKDKWRRSPYTLEQTLSANPSHSRLNAVVLLAISRNEQGADFNMIVSFIQERFKIQHYRWSLVLDSLDNLFGRGVLVKEAGRYNLLPIAIELLTPVRRLQAESDHASLLAEAAVAKLKYAEALVSESETRLELAEAIYKQCACGEPFSWHGLDKYLLE